MKGNKKISLVLTGPIRFNDQAVPDHFKGYAEKKHLFHKIVWSTWAEQIIDRKEAVDYFHNNIGNVVYSVHIPSIRFGDMEIPWNIIRKNYYTFSVDEQLENFYAGAQFIDDDSIIIKSRIEYPFDRIDDFVKTTNNYDECRDINCADFPVLCNHIPHYRAKYSFFFFHDAIWAAGPKCRDILPHEDLLYSPVIAIDPYWKASFFYQENTDLKDAIFLQITSYGRGSMRFHRGKDTNSIDPCDIYTRYMDYVKNNIVFLGDYVDNGATSNEFMDHYNKIYNECLQYYNDGYKSFVEKVNFIDGKFSKNKGFIGGMNSRLSKEKLYNYWSGVSCDRLVEKIYGIYDNHWISRKSKRPDEFLNYCYGFENGILDFENRVNVWSEKYEIDTNSINFIKSKFAMKVGWMEKSY